MHPPPVNRGDALRVHQLQPDVLLHSGSRDAFQLLRRLDLPQEIATDHYPKRLPPRGSPYPVTVQFLQGNRPIHQATIQLDDVEVRSTDRFIDGTGTYHSVPFKAGSTFVIPTQSGGTGWYIEPSGVASMLCACWLKPSRTMDNG